MKAIAWLLAGLALAVALILGVGYFILPSTLDVSRSIRIERPRATVYAQIDDLRAIKEWSPYYAADPRANWSFSGEPGPGQVMRWSSEVKSIGAGDMRLVRETRNESVRLLIRAGDDEAFDSEIVVRPAEGGANVTWLVQAQCRGGAILIPCRYMNLMLQRSIANDLQAGLERLKSMAETLPATDFEGVTPDVVNAPLLPFIYVETTITKPEPSPDDMRAVETGSVARLREFIRQTQPAVTVAGPLYRVTSVWDRERGRYAFRFGYPFSGPAPLTLVGVQIGQTPSGRALRFLHTGPRSEMRGTYERAYAYLRAHRYVLRADPWEIVLQSETPAAPISPPAPPPVAGAAPIAPTPVSAPVAPAPRNANAPVRIEIYLPIEPEGEGEQ